MPLQDNNKVRVTGAKLPAYKAEGKTYEDAMSCVARAFVGAVYQHAVGTHVNREALHR